MISIVLDKVRLNSDASFRVMHNYVFHVDVEYIGTVTRLVDPLIFEPSPIFYFQSKTSDATSQIQIKNPGETKGDISGNERW